MQTAPTIQAAYRLADSTGKPVHVPGYGKVSPDYRPGHTTCPEVRPYLNQR